MKIRIQKKNDGSSVLSCHRDDGTSDWQKNTGRTAAFFPLHDITHFVVESELRARDGFFGLVAAGWSIESTGQRGVADVIPPEALFVENVVGTLDAERASGTRWTAEEFNYAIEKHHAKSGRTPPHVLTDTELVNIRKRRAELFEQWHELAEGETLELDFNVTSAS